MGKNTHQGILCAWQEQISQAAQAPGVKQQLLRRERELLSQFANHYTNLRTLPRHVRRRLQRHWKRSLAALALLLTLGAQPALAATINVRGTCTLVRAMHGAINMLGKTSSVPSLPIHALYLARRYVPMRIRLFVEYAARAFAEDAQLRI